MSASDKSKLDGIADGANNITVDSVRSTSSGNPLQNKVVTAALNAVEDRASALENKTKTAATSSAMGMMSAADKAKLDGIAEGSNKTTVDSVMSTSSTNPVQNKVIASALTAVENRASALETAKETKLDTKTLSAGSTTLSWTNSLVGDSSLIKVYTSVYGVTPISVTQSGTTVTVVFAAQSSAMDACVTVKNG